MCAGHREYHVQFFGSVAERAWIHEKRVVIYQGKQQFEELQAETLRKATNPVEKQKVRTSSHVSRLRKRENPWGRTEISLREGLGSGNS